MESLSNESAIVHINLSAAMAVVESDRQSWHDHRVAVLRLFQQLSRVRPSVAVSSHQDPACPRAAARYSLSRMPLEQLMNKIPEWPDFCVVSPATFAQMFMDSSEFESKVLFSVAFCREASIEVLHPFKSSGCLVQSSDAAVCPLARPSKASCLAPCCRLYFCNGFNGFHLKRCLLRCVECALIFLGRDLSHSQRISLDSPISSFLF